MLQALRLTDRTKFKIAKQVDTPIEDIQALMEYYSDGKLRPYVLLTMESSTVSNWEVISDFLFHGKYRFTDEDDPCMFTEVIAH
jgi:hypothetical protein